LDIEEIQQREALRFVGHDLQNIYTALQRATVLPSPSTTPLNDTEINILEKVVDSGLNKSDIEKINDYTFMLNSAEENVDNPYLKQVMFEQDSMFQQKLNDYSKLVEICVCCKN